MKKILVLILFYFLVKQESFSQVKLAKIDSIQIANADFLISRLKSHASTDNINLVVILGERFMVIYKNNMNCQIYRGSSFFNSNKHKWAIDRFNFQFIKNNKMLQASFEQENCSQLPVLVGNDSLETKIGWETTYLYVRIERGHNRICEFNVPTTNHSSTEFKIPLKLEISQYLMRLMFKKSLTYFYPKE